jgi:hypothetical protein
MLPRKKPMNRGKCQLKRSELKRGDYQLKRSRLKPVSKRYAKMKRETTPARRAYVEEILLCLCGKPATDCHEIAAGSSKQKAMRNRFCWLALCRTCHDRIQGGNIAAQMAMKVLQDKQHFDRVGLNLLMGKAADAVSESDVIEAAWLLGYDNGVQSV